MIIPMAINELAKRALPAIHECNTKIMDNLEHFVIYESAFRQIVGEIEQDRWDIYKCPIQLNFLIIPEAVAVYQSGHTR